MRQVDKVQSGLHRHEAKMDQQPLFRSSMVEILSMKASARVEAAAGVGAAPLVGGREGCGRERAGCEPGCLECHGHRTGTRASTDEGSASAPAAKDAMKKGELRVRIGIK